MKAKLFAPIVAALGVAALPSLGATVDYIVVPSPPPALQVETVPPAETGKVWVPGYYDYKDGQYNWVGGHYEPQRDGFVYVAPRYENGKYYVSRWDEDKTKIKIKEKNGKVKIKEKG